ncbi:hypothetical protein B0H13DRAFT_1903366 [Mycena leptocephala]|nr:hypothetical protein B0H13DRAFT_1903366 [Mycena leptocephala]
MRRGEEVRSGDLRSEIYLPLTSQWKDEGEAWVAWWHERLRQKASEFLLPRLRELDFPYADDQYIGVWVNGAPEETVLRYLAASIPCFIVHEFKGLVTGIADRDVCVQENFLRGTLLDTLLGDDNPYQSIARRQAMVLDSLPGTDDGRLGMHPLANAEDEMRSSSSRLVALAQARRPERARVPTPSPAPLAPLVTPTPDPNPPRVVETSVSLSRTAEPSLPSNSRALPSAPNASIDKYAAPAVVTRVIDSERVPWIVPPPIEARGKGKLDRWALTDLDGTRAWVYQGKGRKEEYVNQWFDRKLGRRLCFGPFMEPPGVTDSHRFGAPVPRFPFFHPGDGTRATPQRASHWMYPNERETRGDAGVTASTPHPYELMRLSDVAAGAGRSKGKMVVRHGNESFEPDESSEDDDDWEGMAVDEPDDAEVPSNVVVLDGLDHEVSAIMFEAFSRDRLARDTRPLSIINAQGRMWMRFADVSAGQRAFGALSGLYPGSVRSFISNSAFEDAAQYTRDLWSPELLEDAPLLANVELPGIEPETTEPQAPAEESPPNELPAPADSAAIAVTPSREVEIASIPDSTPERLESERVVGPEEGPPQFEDVQMPLVLTPAVRGASPCDVRRVTRADAAIQTEAAPDAPTTSRSPEVAGSGQSLIPLGLRLSDPKPALEDRLSDPDALNRKPATESPVKKKARRGKRSGRLVKEQERIREAWRAEQAAVMATAHATGDDSLLGFVEAMDVVADVEADELLDIPRWDHGPDEDMPMAGPSH